MSKKVTWKCDFFVVNLTCLLEIEAKWMYNSKDEQNRELCVVPSRKEAMHMLLEQVYLLHIYILYIELAIVTVVAIALFVALVVTIRRINNEKTHLCLAVREVFLILK